MQAFKKARAEGTAGAEKQLKTTGAIALLANCLVGGEGQTVAAASIRSD